MTPDQSTEMTDAKRSVCRLVRRPMPPTMSWNIQTIANPAELKLIIAPNRDIPEGLKTVVYDFCDRQPRRDVPVSLYAYGYNLEHAVHIGYFDLHLVRERAPSPTSDAAKKEGA